MCSQCDVDALWCDAGLCRSEFVLHVVIMICHLYADMTLPLNQIHREITAEQFILFIYNNHLTSDNPNNRPMHRRQRRRGRRGYIPPNIWGAGDIISYIPPPKLWLKISINVMDDRCWTKLTVGRGNLSVSLHDTTTDQITWARLIETTIDIAIWRLWTLDSALMTGTPQRRWKADR